MAGGRARRCEGMAPAPQGVRGLRSWWRARPTGYPDAAEHENRTPPSRLAGCGSSAWGCYRPRTAFTRAVHSGAGTAR
jgi:hypothetical protein